MLPAGMRDWLPAEARALSALSQRVLGCFESFGYDRVTVPAFEFAEVLERGLGSLDPAEVLRFVEPQTGEVVALRPDMTPQIARLSTSRLADRPWPARICYEGSVVRLRRQRARLRRQIPQAGIELLGADAAAGDKEVLEVAIAAVRAAGLADFVLDLSHARVAGALLDAVAAPHRVGLIEALSLRDPALLSARAQAAKIAAPVRDGLLALLDLAGGPQVLAAARARLAQTPAAEGVEVLEGLVQWAEGSGLAPRVFVDLADVRHLAYYTGALFQILAEGPGEPVVSGGRYDGLLERFGVPRPAAGFAVDLDNLAWAVGAPAADVPARVLLHGGEATLSQEIARGVRGQGVPVAICETDGDAYARSWGFSHRADLSAGTLIDLRGGGQSALGGSGASEVTDQIVAALRPRAQSSGGET